MSVPETQSMAQIFINKLLKKLDKQLEGKKVEGSSRNGAVKIVISGQFRVLEVKISPRLSCNNEQLEKSVAAAVDDALQKGSELLRSEAQKLMGS
ncbi:MAG: YbaB/EbfC family nucleoid-associated protein [Syntrophaceticus sp.]|jgi:DNA-binding protein YbaB